MHSGLKFKCEKINFFPEADQSSRRNGRVAATFSFKDEERLSSAKAEQFAKASCEEFGRLMEANGYKWNQWPPNIAEMTSAFNDRGMLITYWSEVKGRKEVSQADVELNYH